MTTDSNRIRQGIKDKWAQRVPRMTREERIDLHSRLENSARWNSDFVIMMSLATALAGLGLMQNSTAVVIGGMLVAPLMSPLIGAGFALMQGNLSLFRDSLKAMGYGIMAALFIAILLGFITPTYTPTLEVESRGQVNLLDLAVALLSGMAAAYAMARPNLLAIMSGVAIAAALVPPLAVVGMTIPDGYFLLSGAAAVLFITNLVAIILGSAIVFYMLGVSGTLGSGKMPLWARRMVFGLLIVTCLLTLPLTDRLVEQSVIGQNRPSSYPVSTEVRNAVYSRILLEADVEVVAMVRTGNSLESAVNIVLASSRPLGTHLHDELVHLVEKKLGEDTTVKVVALATVWDETPDKDF